MSILISLGRGRRSAALIALFLAALTAAVPHRSWACSCPEQEFAEQVERSATIFSGTVAAADDASTGSEIGSGDIISYTIEVDRVYKGEVSAETAIRSARDSASCGVELVPGRAYLLLIDEDTADRVTTCGGSGELSAFSAEDLALLGTGQPPTNGTDAIDSTSTDGTDSTVPDSALAWGLGALGGLGVLAVVAPAIARRRRRGAAQGRM